MAEESKPQIPYVPFSTFVNAIESMEHTLPPRLDKSMWKNFSGAIQSQLWSAFKFFQLVNGDGSPTKALVDLVRDKANRKTHLKALLTEYYPPLMGLDLSTATLGHFNETMKAYSLGPETQKKASSFFLQAAKAAGMPLSTYITSNTRTPGLKRAKNKAAARARAVGSQTPQTIISNQSHGPSMTIQLENGITLSLSASADTFKMASHDRAFVLDLLGLLESHATFNSDEESEAPKGE